MSLSEVKVLQALDQRALELVILPTEQCNFRCIYCYEDFVIGKMSTETVSKIKYFLVRESSRLKSLSISWFGGEPLLAKSLILEISDFAQSLCLEKNIKFTGGMTTNGFLLTKSTLENLVSLNQDYFQISIDGPAEFHDTTRLLKNGSGTFDRIWKNLLTARQSDLKFRIHLRIHVTADNYQALDKFVDTLYSNFGEDSRFKIFFHEINDLGSNKSKFRHLISNKVLEFTRKYNKNYRDEETFSPEGYICSAAKPNQLMIRANGRVGKCTLALNDKRNDLGTISSTGELLVDNVKFRSWISGFRDYNEKSLSCPLQTLPTNSNFTDSEIPVIEVV